MNIAIAVSWTLPIAVIKFNARKVGYRIADVSLRAQNDRFLLRGANGKDPPSLDTP